ncbi:MAG: Holliday junction resolvase RuvX [Akkermansia sp.]
MHPALGIDYGDARIGIAATDDMGILAYPVETVKNGAAPLDRIVALATQKAVKTLVLGIPVRMDGTEGTAAAKVRQFGDTLRALLPDIPMVYIDECLTTVAAQEKLRAAGKKAKNQRPIIDQAAAVEILNIWMGNQF